MTRQNATNFSGGLQFPYATAGTDLFMKEDVQVLAQAVDQHNHTSGKGLALAAGAIPNGTITSAMIADGTITGTDIATGTITTTQIQDGTIATADLANQAVTNAKLGTDTARLNLLTNGGFEIWQRNTSFSGVNQFTADRWQLVSAGSGSSGGVSRQAAPNTDLRSQYAMAVNVVASTVPAAGVGVTNGVAMYQVIEPYASAFRGVQVSFSIRVRSDVAGQVQPYINDGVSQYSAVGQATSTTYTTYSITATLASNAASFSVGVNFAGPNVNYYLDNAMLVTGSVAADYAPLHPADDLARCLRYYEIIGGNGEIGFSGYGGGSAPAGQYVRYRAQKAVYPTYTKNGTWTVTNCGQPSFSYVSAGGLSFQVTVTTTGNFNVSDTGSAGNNFVIEANP
jgi:hypothetical protein